MRKHFDDAASEPKGCDKKGSLAEPAGAESFMPGSARLHIRCDARTNNGCKPEYGRSYPRTKERHSIGVHSERDNDRYYSRSIARRQRQRHLGYLVARIRQTCTRSRPERLISMSNPHPQKRHAQPNPFFPNLSISNPHNHHPHNHEPTFRPGGPANSYTAPRRLNTVPNPLTTSA